MENNIVVRSAAEYNALFDGDRFDQFMQLVYTKNDIVKIFNLDIEVDTNDLWLLYDRNVAFKINLNTTVKFLLDTLLNVGVNQQLYFTKIVQENGNDIFVDVPFKDKTFEDIFLDYPIVICDFTIL